MHVSPIHVWRHRATLGKIIFPVSQGTARHAQVRRGEVWLGTVWSGKVWKSPVDESQRGFYFSFTRIGELLARCAKAWLARVRSGMEKPR